MAQNWRDKTVIVTGASAGLGKCVSEEFARHGAKVVLAARRPEPLHELAARLNNSGGSAVAIPTDVTSPSDLARLVDQTLAQSGKVDCVVCNAGRSMRKGVAETTTEDFRELLELNFLSVVELSRLSLPHLLASRGHLVLIGSLASKAASRYVGSYPAGKFALAAYAQQLRLELGPQGLHVLLVCPGPIARNQSRTPDELTVRGDTAPGLPQRAYRPGGGVRTMQIDPDWLARRIVRACERRSRELVVPGYARLIFAAMALSPRLGDWLIRRLT